jgi:hypothetical protein
MLLFGFSHAIPPTSACCAIVGEANIKCTLFRLQMGTAETSFFAEAEKMPLFASRQKEGSVLGK